MTEFQQNLIRMWDRVRTANKGEPTCDCVNCGKCILNEVCNADDSSYYKAEQVIELVNKWAKKHPEKLNREEFENYMAQDLTPGKYIVKIKMKYDHEMEYSYSNEILIYTGVDWKWLNDWWEGQQDVQIRGLIEVSDLEIPEVIDE